MLGKLMKYEYKATGRMLLPLYGALLVISLLINLQGSFSNSLFASSFQGMETIRSWIYGITILLYAGLMGAVMIMTMLLLIQRFYKNLLGTEGYLMFTLPTSVDRLIFSKLIPATVWSLVSCVVAILSIMTLAMNVQQWGEFFQGVGRIFRTMYAGIGIHGYILAAELLVLLIVGTMQSVLQVYGGIAIGHLVNRHRILGGIGGYLALSVVTSLLMQVVMMAAYPLLESEIFQRWLHDGMLISTQGAAKAMELFLLFIIVLCALFAAGYYVVTRLILKKKLNLE